VEGLGAFLTGVSEEIVFPLMFTVVPENLGSYSVTTVEQVTVEDREPFKQPRELHATKDEGEVRAIMIVGHRRKATNSI
jgi:hypothetical protein